MFCCGDDPLRAVITAKFRGRLLLTQFSLSRVIGSLLTNQSRRLMSNPALLETIEYREIHVASGTLRGLVHKPSRLVGNKNALTLHGFFSSNKVGPARLYVQLARLLAKYHYRVWRFDCLGVGDSDGDF